MLHVSVFYSNLTFEGGGDGIVHPLKLKFNWKRPGACIIKLFTVVIVAFVKKCFIFHASLKSPQHHGSSYKSFYGRILQILVIS
jgi:hypothetical protein